MTMPLEEIAPAVSYREWVKAYRTDVDTIPVLLAVLVELSTPSLSSSRTDNVRVSGSRSMDYAPIFDKGSHWDLDQFWSALCVYVTAVQRNTGGVTPVDGMRTADRPTTRQSAKDIGDKIADWLDERAEQITDYWADLAHAEGKLRAEIHWGRAQFLSSWRPRRETPGTCAVSCGAENVVRIVWQIHEGEAIRVRVCMDCGHFYGLAPIPRRWLGSKECLHGNHQDCESLNCECDCGHPARTEIS